eukprot:1160548-Pelagomonas_calceolata.AAC.8
MSRQSAKIYGGLGCCRHSAGANQTVSGHSGRGCCRHTLQPIQQPAGHQQCANTPRQPIKCPIVTAFQGRPPLPTPSDQPLLAQPFVPGLLTLPCTSTSWQRLMAQPLGTGVHQHLLAQPPGTACWHSHRHQFLISLPLGTARHWPLLAEPLDSVNVITESVWMLWVASRSEQSEGSTANLLLGDSFAVQASKLDDVVQPQHSPCRLCSSYKAEAAIGCCAGIQAGRCGAATTQFLPLVLLIKNWICRAGHFRASEFQIRVLT